MSQGRKHRRHVTLDEAKLWRAVTKDFKQLSPVGLADDVSDQVPEVPTLPLAKSKKSKSPGAAPAPAKTKPPNDRSPLAGFEPKRARRLASGRLPIDARLDLHGLRQDEARTELLGFLLAAQRQGLKHVKVITGKGSLVASDDEPMRPFSLFDEGRRGVLREQVPRWLSEPVFRSLVVSFTVAGRGHGGGGALFVQVRKYG